jgi:hypothetical protein
MDVLGNINSSYLILSTGRINEITSILLKPNNPIYESVNNFIKSYCKFNDYTILNIKSMIYDYISNNINNKPYNINNLFDNIK